MSTILVVHASKAGSTQEVAERIAAVLRESSAAVDVRPATEVTDLGGYDAVVLGSAIYTGRLHHDARRFLHRRRGALAGKPLAVFAMGPLTLEEKDVASSRAAVNRALAKVSLEPVAVAIFGGVVDPRKLHFPFNRMPATDARDWKAVERWARSLSSDLVPRSPIAAG